MSKDSIPETQQARTVATAAEYERCEHREMVSKVRQAVLIGLSAFGELKRMRDDADAAERMGRPYPRGMRPIDVCGDPNAILNFSEALQFLEHVEEMPLVMHDGRIV
ncbi:MAG: hypothetical protein KDH17_03365 [Rhodocyclaceae bacterium]|nr:hypothetical protein [Rhodocyclaceae bacterium]